eukprot:COSAG01_NODE_6497_length_3631_cov_1.901472_4_plen_236_part_00
MREQHTTSSSSNCSAVSAQFAMAIARKVFSLVVLVVLASLSLYGAVRLNNYVGDLERRVMALEIRRREAIKPKTAAAAAAAAAAATVAATAAATAASTAATAPAAATIASASSDPQLLTSSLDPPAAPKPVHKPSRSMAMALAAGLSAHAIRNFHTSLVRHSKNTRTVLFVDAIPVGMADGPTLHFHLINSKLTEPWDGYHPSTYRWMIYDEYPFRVLFLSVCTVKVWCITKEND